MRRAAAGVVNVLATPYKVWSQRNSTEDEIRDLVQNQGWSLINALQVNDKLLDEVSTHIDAAIRLLRVNVDTGLERHIDEALNASTDYRGLLDLMPQRVPKALIAYQGEFSVHDLVAADEAIKACGVEMAEGQVLFHGGLWAGEGSLFTTSRPFSTSFCPQVALRNAEWQGKAYDSDRVDLMVVCVTQPNTKAYVYSREGCHGNEKEVVFASGARLLRVRETLVGNISVSKMTAGYKQVKKDVPAYMVEVQIS